MKLSFCFMLFEITCAGISFSLFSSSAWTFCVYELSCVSCANCVRIDSFSCCSSRMSWVSWLFWSFRCTNCRIFA